MAVWAGLRAFEALEAGETRPTVAFTATVPLASF
jgi:hypothetical protein